MELDAYNLEEVRKGGEELHEVNQGAWDFDVMTLFKYKRRYVVFRDSGCSCYSPYDDPKSYEGDSFTKAALMKVQPSWAKGSSVEREMAQWIAENVK